MFRNLDRTLLFAIVWVLLTGARAPSKPTPASDREPGFDPAWLAGLKARLIGPAGMSGRVTAIAAHPRDPMTVYAGAATGGVWKSANGGTTWTPVFDDQPVHAIGAIALAPSNPETIWVGTGEGNTRNSASVGAGVFRSLDGGKTWKQLGLEATERIHRIHVHPDDPDTAWVAATGSEWGENSERGVFKTTDGGKTWRKVLYVDQRTGCADIAIDPNNPDKLFAAMWQFRRWPYYFRSGGPGSGLYRSEDGGESWKKLLEEDGMPAGTLGRIGVAIAASDPSIIYALVEAEKSALIRSADGGRTFTTVNSDINVVPRPFYFAELRVDPTRPNRVYSLDYGVRVSDDGGKSFTNLSGASALHGDFHAMWIDPSDGRRIYFGDDGGVGFSNDRGITAHHAGNLPLAQFYHVAVDDQIPYNVYGGLQDNSSWRGPSESLDLGGIRNDQWRLAGIGDGFETLPVQGFPDEAYSMAQGGYLQRWNLVNGEVRWIRPPEIDSKQRLRFNWNAALAQDPFEAGTIYYGSQYLHRSSDRGESWITISPDLTTNNPAFQLQDSSGGLTPDVTAAENYCSLVTVAPSLKQRGLIWTGSDDGRIHVTLNGGTNWTSVESALPKHAQGAWVAAIEPSRHDPASAFVVLDDHRRGNLQPLVFKTTDYGKSWVSLATPELHGYALSLVQDPVKPELLFLGTEFGLYFSLDGGSRWYRFKHGLPTASVMDLAIQARETDLVIGTHGRSIYIIDDYSPLRALDPQQLAAPLRLFEPQPATLWSRTPPPGGFSPGSDAFRGSNSPNGVQITAFTSLAGLPLPDDEKERERKEREREQKQREALIWGPHPASGPPETEKPVDNPAEKPTEETRKSESTDFMVEVRNGAGQLVRHFKSPAKLGLNRFVWDLSRNDWRTVGVDPPADGSTPGGQPVVPGVYELTVRLRDHRATTRVQVHGDARLAVSEQDWHTWDRAVIAEGERRERLFALVEELKNLRTDVENKLALRKRDKDRLRSPRDLPPDEPEKDELASAWEKLTAKLKTHERTLWAGRDAKGIQASMDVNSALSNAMWAISGVGRAPSPSVQGAIDRAERLLQEAEAAQRKLWEDEVKPFLATLP